jgi:GNAT superfamily N-acetyltransferase
MVAYRFCRPDDIPLICRAANECFLAHFPGMPALTEEGLKTEVRELDVWISNAMVARQGEEPIGILMGTKRPEEVLIHRVGVRRDFQRQGVGQHLLTSLSQKLAVLGPPRLLAEVPEDPPGLVDFFAAAGYRPEGRLVDMVRPFRPPGLVPEELIGPVTVEEMEAADLLRPPAGAPWMRDIRALSNQRQSLQGLGVASMEGYGAFLLYRPSRTGEPVLDVYAWGGPERGDTELLLGFLLDFLNLRHPHLALRIPREPEDSGEIERLRRLGFAAGAGYRRMSATATPL